jgi:hemerythrin-like metal-binding protein
MALLEWSETYRTGLPRVDIQHQEIFRLINLILDPSKETPTKETVASVLRFMISYVGYHFDDEERFMRASRYSGYSEHRAQHDALTQKTNELYTACLESDQDMGEELALFMGTWLAAHIIQTDGPFVEWVKTHLHTHQEVGDPT